MLSLDENLKKRLLTIIIGAPIAIGILYTGGIIFNIALSLISFVAFYEWFSMSKKAKLSLIISAFGFIYVFAGIYSIYELHSIGFDKIITLLLCVWASDSVAYIFGKTIGGPKMSPTISPNKTWSGYVGALLGSMFVIVFAIDGLSYPVLVLLGIVLGVVAQSGDLLVSALKRHVKVKDTGKIFPGHGGVLDRIDALLLVAPVLLSLIMFIEGGV